MTDLNNSAVRADSDDRLSRTVRICNQRGLHARASAKFVKLAGAFDAEVTVSRDDQTVAGTSIMGLLVLGASPGCEIEIAATGPQAEKALDELAALVEAGFHES
ncbi:HPr family phosphocarrier protein [Microbaculum sp. FT89]|uniref:HPr family phosphocarrier protein n=1 Tax=Microbaculum sp. FT89 TaxID=3447298 RepID=UPI003F52A9B2